MLKIDPCVDPVEVNQIAYPEEFKKMLLKIAEYHDHDYTSLERMVRATVWRYFSGLDAIT